MKTLKPGDRVRWRYWHSFGRNGTWLLKQGEYVGKRRHTVKHWRNLGAKQMAGVMFDGNRRMTFVPLDELRPDEATDALADLSLPRHDDRAAN